MDFAPIQEAVKAFGLDAGLYAIGVVLAVLLRFGRASWRWFDDPHTYLAGILFGLGGAALVLTQEHRAWQAVVIQGLTLGVVVLIGERTLRKYGSKLGLPADNQYVTPDNPPQP